MQPPPRKPDPVVIMFEDPPPKWGTLFETPPPEWEPPNQPPHDLVVESPYRAPFPTVIEPSLRDRLRAVQARTKERNAYARRDHERHMAQQIAIWLDTLRPTLEEHCANDDESSYCATIPPEFQKDQQDILLTRRQITLWAEDPARQLTALFYGNGTVLLRWGSVSESDRVTESLPVPSAHAFALFRQWCFTGWRIPISGLAVGCFLMAILYFARAYFGHR